MLAYSYVYINCAVFPVAGALIAYAYDVAERTVAARKECCRKVETRRAYRAARASECPLAAPAGRISKRASAQVCRCAFTHPHNWVHIWQRQGLSALPSADAGPVATRRPCARRRQAAEYRRPPGNRAAPVEGKHMKTIVLVNQKGGVGKTTFADEIAWGLERRGREVGFINPRPAGRRESRAEDRRGREGRHRRRHPGLSERQARRLRGGRRHRDRPRRSPSQRGLRAMKRTIQPITGVNPELEIGPIVNRYSDKRIIDRSFLPTSLSTADDLPILGCVPTAEAAFKRRVVQPTGVRGAAGGRGGRDRGDSGQGGGDAVMARTKKADSAINSFFH